MSVTPVALADRLFTAKRDYEHVEVEVCHVLWSIFGSGGWEDFTADHYDRSIEVFGVKEDVRLTPDQQQMLWDKGFERCWTHVARERADNEIGEIYYYVEKP